MKNTQPATSQKLKRRSLLLLLLVGLSLANCGLLPSFGSDPNPQPAQASTDLVKTGLETAPAVVDSITGLVGTVALWLVILSLAFKRSRSAISGMLTALAEAVTYRINNWKVKRIPEENGGS